MASVTSASHGNLNLRQTPPIRFLILTFNSNMTNHWILCQLLFCRR